MSEQEKHKDPVFSPLVSLDPSVGDQVAKTSDDSNEVLQRISEIDKEENDLYSTLLKVADDIREIKEAEQQPKKISTAQQNILAQELKNLLSLQSSIKLQLESLGNMRIQLYKDLGEKYVSLQTAVGEGRNDLVNQKTVSDIMGDELKALEQQYQQLADEKSRKIKLTEIDTYYGKRYRSYGDFMRLIAYICIPLLVVAIIYRMKYIGDGLRSALVMLVLVVGGYLVMMKGLDIWYRDNMNWDEYRWPKTQQEGESVWDYDKKQFEKWWGERGDLMNDVEKTLGFACVNEMCCKHPKVTWDKKNKMCVMKGGGKSGHGHHKGHHKDHHKGSSGQGAKDLHDTKLASQVTAAHKDGFAPLHPAPVCPSGKALSAQVNESCGVACDLVNLAQNYCGGAPDGSPISGFDGF